MDEKLKLEKNEDFCDSTDNFVAVISHKLDNRQVHKLAVLKECLEKVGISLNATRHENYDALCFKIDFDTYNKVVNRGAGRKKDYFMNERYKECTVSELNVKLKTMKKCDIIAELGCPKATFYRILKNLEKYDAYSMNDTSIWIYTS